MSLKDIGDVLGVVEEPPPVSGGLLGWVVFSVFAPRQINIEGWSDFVQNYRPIPGENYQYPDFPDINEEPEPPIGSIPQSQFPQFSS